MLSKAVIAPVVAALGLTLACSNQDREREREKTRAAAERMRADARRLASDAKHQAQSLDHNIGRALQGGPGNGHDAMSGASAKLDNAAILAKVKTKLAADLGLSTVTNINVDVHGGLVTLSGTVPSEDFRKRAEESAMQVSGVARVTDDLRVSP